MNVIVAATTILLSAPPSAAELLKSMDNNLQYESRTSTMTMKVIDSRRTREFKMRTFGRGESDTAIEYLEPKRDKGTRMLKKGDNLWLYMPRAERTQKISGHMLRQGMMGSDISYEDMMQGADFEEIYDAVVDGEGEVDGRPCWKVVATAKKPDEVSYPKRVIWIDKQYLVPSKQELYALSGLLLKTWTMSDIKKVDGLNVPMKMELADQLRKGSKTVIEIHDIDLKVKLADEIFSRRWLERKQ